MYYINHYKRLSNFSSIYNMYIYICIYVWLRILSIYNSAAEKE